MLALWRIPIVVSGRTNVAATTAPDTYKRCPDESSSEQGPEESPHARVAARITKETGGHHLVVGRELLPSGGDDAIQGKLIPVASGGSGFPAALAS